MSDETKTPTRLKATDRADATGRTSLSSVSNALKMMNAFSNETNELGITELAKALDVAKSTAHRIASTLVCDGFLEKNPVSDKYRLGLALFRLGALVRRRMNVSYESRPMLMDLRARTNETILLAIPDEDQILYAFHLESSHAIRMRSDIGERKPMVCTAEGQVLLAHMPEADRNLILQKPIKQRTAYTIIDTDALKTKLEAIRLQGYSLDDQESETGMRSIAAPIYNNERAVVASVALAGPVIRMKDELIPSLADQVIQTAMEISHRLGY